MQQFKDDTPLFMFVEALTVCFVYACIAQILAAAYDSKILSYEAAAILLILIAIASFIWWSLWAAQLIEQQPNNSNQYPSFQFAYPPQQQSKRPPARAYLVFAMAIIGTFLGVLRWQAPYPKATPRNGKTGR